MGFFLGRLPPRQLHFYANVPMNRITKVAKYPP